ncbi:putative mfs maltose permease protein [Neofusicoccum parvum UCRNP2]|uniref:Putative mfs maltose permease protein n=1 Tax=Botryosphaeria parva (strain UCR-NP2) TaxID=1287680 RepID=R1G2T9_BOTPV|nr:putative mfs maltose permease protein [Neofusicoccum parvum UCRNP2]
MPTAEKTAEIGCAEVADVDAKRISADAARATQAEHELTFTQAVKLYKKAIIWSMIVSLACTMDSYDMQIVSAFYAYPSFQKKYGELLDDGSYSVPASWQLGLSLASNFGMILGVFTNGWLIEHMGPRKLMLCSFTALTGFIFITFFAPNIQVLLVGELLCGLPWGVFAAVAPSDLNVGTNYIDCFRGINLRRTEIASVSWGAIQNYLTYFFKQAGLSTDDSFKLSLGTFSIAFLGTVFSWFFQGRFGRRSIFISGLCAMTPIMWLIALIDFAPATSGRRWAQCCMMLIWFAFYGLTIGPVPYAIATEVPATRLRMKTIAVSRNSYYIFSIVNIIVAPYLLNPSEANLHGKAAFPAAGFSSLLLLWAWFRLPETKGRTFEELDVLFERETPARKFSATVLEAPRPTGSAGGQALDGGK